MAAPRAGWQHASWRSLSSPAGDSDELRRLKGDFQDLFAEARLNLGDAADSFETVYFNDDMEDARLAVTDCLAAYDAMLAAVDKDAADALQRENGLKVEQLRGELKVIEDRAIEDH